jgi:rhodanese-related sulfurtransferase
MKGSMAAGFAQWGKRREKAGGGCRCWIAQSATRITGKSLVVRGWAGFIFFWEVIVMLTVELQNPAKAKEFFEDKLAFTTGPVELNRMIEQKQNINIVDVREAEDYAKGHIPGAINLPKEKWGTYAGLEKEKTNVLYCYTQVCHLAATAAVEFADEGYPVMELEGGFETWKEYELPIKR